MVLLKEAREKEEEEEKKAERVASVETVGLPEGDM